MPQFRGFWDFPQLLTHLGPPAWPVRTGAGARGRPERVRVWVRGRGARPRTCSRRRVSPPLPRRAGPPCGFGGRAPGAVAAARREGGRGCLASAQLGLPARGRAGARALLTAPHLLGTPSIRGVATMPRSLVAFVLLVWNRVPGWGWEWGLEWGVGCHEGARTQPRGVGREEALNWGAPCLLRNTPGWFPSEVLALVGTWGPQESFEAVGDAGREREGPDRE